MADERQPTRHERDAGQEWDASYHDGPAPWDIGGPQPAVVRLAEADVFRGSVLDPGCGTGENALCLAERGLEVFGCDVAPTAVAMAQASARQRELADRVTFAVADALNLGGLGRQFDTVLDSALFHALDADERRTYVTGLAAVTQPGVCLYLLCFSDGDHAVHGPHPVTEGELREPFEATSGWEIASIGPELLLSRFSPEGAAAWLAVVRRV